MYRLIYILCVPFISGVWGSCSVREQYKEPPIAVWTRAHMEDMDFIPQVRYLIDSAGFDSPMEQEGFVRNITDVLCRSDREGLAMSVAAWLHGIDLPGNDKSEIGRRLLTQLSLSGNNAPALPFGKGDNRGMIVLFFESDCRACKSLVDELASAYDSLLTEEIHIVSLAADADIDIYENHTTGLPWRDKYCDYESFAGKYFSIWGVAATPTMYYVDDKGIVKGRCSSLREISELLNNDSEI